MTDYLFGFDEKGAPVLLAPLVEAPPDPPAPDPEADKRARGSDSRRRDAVVDAARTLEDLSPAGVEKFARQRWRGDRPITQEDFESFSSDARAQRVHDVVDALDQRIRTAVNGRSKITHVSIPRGIVGKSLASLDPEEKAQVVERLKEKGWKPQQIFRHGVRKFDKDGSLGKLLQEDEPKA